MYIRRITHQSHATIETIETIETFDTTRHSYHATTETSATTDPRHLHIPESRNSALAAFVFIGKIRCHVIS